MSKFADEYADIIRRRRMLPQEFDWDSEPVIKEEINLLKRDMGETIRFIQTECTCDQLGWMSEVFDEVMKIAPCPKFIEACRKKVGSYPEGVDKSQMTNFVNWAEEAMNFAIDSGASPVC